MTTAQKPFVVVTRCENCGKEHTMFKPYNHRCPRCDAGVAYQYSRVINDPAPETLFLARATSAGVQS